MAKILVPQATTVVGKLLLPRGWYIVQAGQDGALYSALLERICVIESLATELDGKRWHHVSVSRPDRMPSYEDLCFVKKHWIGEDRYAYQVFAPRTKHVNIHQYCLHLWSCLDGPALPDFTRGGNTL